MALKKLKSAFHTVRPPILTDVVSTKHGGEWKGHTSPAPFAHSDVTKHTSNIQPFAQSDVTKHTSDLSGISATDFFQSNVIGFTHHFNDPAMSKFIDVPNVFDTRDVVVDAGSLTAQQLGFNDFDGSFQRSGYDDIRFTAGLGWPFSKTKMQFSVEGIETSIFYINTPTGDIFGLSGAVSKWGKVTEDIKTKYNLPESFNPPTIPFSVNIHDYWMPRELTYQDTVFELTHNVNDAPVTTGISIGRNKTADPDRTRGIIFQAIGSKNLTGGQDFSLQDPPNPLPQYNLQSPITGFNTGNIQFKNINAYLDANIRGLSDLIPNIPFPSLPDISIPNFGLPNLPNPFSGLSLPSLGKFSLPGLPDMPNLPFPFFSENGFLDKFNIPFSGFGRMIKFPNIPIPNIPIPDMSGLLKAGAYLAGGLSLLAGWAVGLATSGLGKLAGALSKIPIPDISGIAGQLNPIESLTLPSLELRNPLVSVRQPHGKLARYNPRALQYTIPRRLASPAEVDTIGGSTTGDRVFADGTPSTPYGQIGQVRYGGTNDVDRTNYYPRKLSKEHGDPVTLAHMFKSKDILTQTGVDVDSEENGMPFYFKDLRDGTYIVLRGYIESISENVSPNWNSENYIGRSEPVYVYENAERNVSFDLKLHAGAALELDAIYGKLRRLTSLCYPQYVADYNIGKLRMKPPLVRMRLGELYGHIADRTKAVGIHEHENTIDQLGFIKSLTYTVPESATWEFRKGQRVPQYVECSIDFQMIHDSPPDIMTQFHGYMGEYGYYDLSTNLQDI